MAGRIRADLEALPEAPAMRWAEDSSCRLACIVMNKIAKPELLTTNRGGR